MRRAFALPTQHVVGYPRTSFNDVGWPFVRERIEAVNWPGGRVYLLDIIDSVVSRGADRFLAVDVSMHDMVVTLQPLGNPPYEVIFVRAPGSMKDHPEGTVLIEFLSTVGKHTWSTRPAVEAVPLFWRYVETEFGLRPTDGDAVTPRPRSRQRNIVERIRAAPFRLPGRARHAKKT